jgi:hypothetical protein
MSQLTDEEAKEYQKMLVDTGLAEDMDEAAHMLVDMGEIGSMQHAAILSKEERERIYE